MLRQVSALAAEWIEIFGSFFSKRLQKVSALAAEWIEISYRNLPFITGYRSPPSRRSGLKLRFAL